MSFKTYDTNDYIHDLDMLIILHYLKFLFSFPTRSGCREKSKLPQEITSTLGSSVGRLFLLAMTVSININIC